MPANLKYDLYLACATGDGIDVKAYEALHTTLDFASVYDLIEMQTVSATWSEALRDNSRMRAEIEANAKQAAAAGRRPLRHHRR